jgi:probable F420-dependent oxidoreductase
MRMGIAPWGADLDEWVGAAVAADRAGMTDVWTSELHRSPFVPLAAAAGPTSGIALGTAIALAFVRSPFAAALAALDLDELAGGRLRFGVGTGVKRLVEDWHGRPFSPPRQRLEEWITGFRTVVAGAHRGDPLEVEAELEPLHVRGYQRPYPPQRDAIPVYVAAVGPRLTALAGEVADGWISHELTSPQQLRERTWPALESGLAAGGRQRGDLDVVVSACCVIDDDRAEARRTAAHSVAFYASVRTYQPLFEEHGFGAQAAAVREAFRAGDVPAMVDAVDDEMVDTFTLAGRPDDVRRGLQRFEGLADAVKLSPPTYFVEPEVTRAAQTRTLATLGG